MGFFCWKDVMFELKNTEEKGIYWILTQLVESNVR